MKIEINFPNHVNQYIAAFAANLIFMSHGTMIGQLSPATPILMSEGTPLKTGPLNNEQLSWIGSVNVLGAISGTFIFGIITLYLGCKRTILIFALPSIIFYSLIYFGDSYYHILIARFFTGIGGGGIQTVVVLYIADIANNDIRGRLGAMSFLLRNFGVLMAYIVGAIVPYAIVPCIFIFVPIIFVISFSLLPNTPNFHFKKANLQKAEDALKFYKEMKTGSITEDANFVAEFERLKALANHQKEDQKICVKDVLNRKALKCILNGSLLASLAYTTGFLVFSTYAVLIFKEAGATNINPNISAISMAVLQMIGNLCTASFSDSLGRRTLLICSLLGSAFGIFTFALYCYTRSIGYDVVAFEWIPVLCLSFVLFSASVGVVPLVFICMVEHMPFKIRTIGLTICNVFMNLVSFTVLKLFPILMASFGLHATMLIFGISCTLGSIYVFFVVRETKGISLESNE